MALLHWYIIPIGLKLGFSHVVLANFSVFVEAIEMAMTIAPRSRQDILEHADCVSFNSFMCHSTLNGMAQYELVHRPLWKELLEKWVIKSIQKRHHLQIWPTSYMKQSWSKFFFCNIYPINN
jgi:hypothetical protein